MHEISTRRRHDNGIFRVRYTSERRSGEPNGAYQGQFDIYWGRHP